jgi:hypothetical protein
LAEPVFLFKKKLTEIRKIIRNIYDENMIHVAGDFEKLAKSIGQFFLKSLMDKELQKDIQRRT